jgi:dienelactone hydrolase/mono/diheme cytochrome c family protein
MLPSCEGHKAYQQTWARALSERGYVSLVVDDYFMHDRGRTCGIREPAARADLLRMRLLHALGAARYLSTRPEVDRGRMAMMGWGDAPVGALVGDVEAVGPRLEVFKAAVAVTPTTCDGRGRSSSRPMLVLRAESDGTERGNPCDALADTPALEVRVYAGTLPGFDDPQAGLAEPSDAGRAGTAPRRYDRLAHARAIEDVAGFLNRRLPPVPSEGEHPYAAGPTPAVSEGGTWAVDPHAPGPDLPPAGGSAFDAVFSRVTPAGVVHDVPFPFPRLLQMLEHAAGGEAMSRSPLDATLIPLGRSLQREAAAPDYFQSPRVVVAVTGEPESGTGPLGIRLENRLFLGYQPRARMVEIISYNEAAGRFEFQVVRDYGPGREPRVRYARRALCTSCHQNAGPIFADASWDETTANPRVASRLEGLGAQFHGVPVTNVDRAVVAIDKATDEANLLPVYQRLWSEGCASARPTEVARCRAGALQAMVQYRLSNSAGFERTAALYAEGYLPLQRRNWTRRWPGGLLIPNPNLPNRSPLMSPSPSVVSVALDPLRRRPPMARWKASSARDLDRLVRGLSRSLPDRHMGVLARYLREADEGAPGHSLTATCKVIRRGFAGRPRLLQIECRTGPKTGAGFHLRAQLRVTPDGTAEGEAGWLEMGGGTYARRTMVGRVEDAQAGSRIALRLVGRDGETAIRAPDGNFLLGFALAWDEGVADSATRFDATGMLSIAGDFPPVASTLERLAAGASASSPLLTERFDGARLSGWLLAELGVLPASRCCDSRPTPDPGLDVEAGPADAALSVALEHRGPLLTFRRYCGTCHGSDTSYPPGFLRGGGETILSTVAQCAERIYYRLSMWHRPPEHQGVPPMPPAQGLSLAGTTADDWRQSESLERLTAYARELLVEEGRDPDAVLDGSYHATRACLANRDEQRGTTAASSTGG